MTRPYKKKKETSSGALAPFVLWEPTKKTSHQLYGLIERSLWVLLLEQPTAGLTTTPVKVSLPSAL
jgi:hypothetical protein